MTKDKWISVAKGALIAAAGAFGAYVVDAMSTAGLGVYGPAVGAILSVAVNALRKLLADPEPANA